MPLPYVMAAFRVGFSRIWERLVDRARGQDLVPSDVLVDAASDIWAAHDTLAEAMASAYRDTAMAQVLRDERERSALVAALLEARVLEDTTVWEIADLLGLPRQGPFVVAAAESTQIAQEALPHADTQLRIRGIGSAWRLLPELHVGIIRLPDAGHLGQLTTVLTGTARARVGVSPAYTQLTDTAAALRFARVAMATTPPGSPAVTLFDDHPLAVAAVSAPDTMRHTRRPCSELSWTFRPSSPPCSCKLSPPGGTTPVQPQPPPGRCSAIPTRSASDCGSWNPAPADPCPIRGQPRNFSSPSRPPSCCRPLQHHRRMAE